MNAGEANNNTKYRFELEKVRHELESRINNYLQTINTMERGRAPTLLRCKILNSLLRPDFKGQSQNEKNITKQLRESSNLASNVYKTICYLNFLGNSSDCAWFNLYARNLDRLFKVDSQEYRLFTEWLQVCEKILRSCFENSRSGFYTNVFTNWADWFVQGISCLRVDYHPKAGQYWLHNNNEKILFSNIDIEDILLDQEEWGEISKVAYRFELTLEQAVQRNHYELRNICRTEQEAESIELAIRLDKDNLYKDRKYKFIDFTIETPRFADWATNLVINKKYIRMIICETTNKIVYVSEEDTLPYIISRLFPTNHNPYGMSSLWNSVKGFDFERALHEAKSKNIAYHTAPIMMSAPGYSSQVLEKFGGHVPPGAILEAIDTNGRPLLMPMQIGGDLRLLEATYQQTCNELQNALMANDIMPVNSAGMSATESLRLSAQWHRRILPLIESRKQDFLAPLCIRCLYLLRDLGVIPPSPIDGIVEGIDAIELIGIEFGGHLRNASQVQALLDLDNCINMIVKFGYGEILNVDTISRTIATKFNIPAEYLKSKEQLQEETKAKAQAQEQQMVEEYLQKARAS